MWLRDGLAHRKILFESTLTFSDDVIHVLVGVAIQFAAALLLRRSVAHFRTLLPVYVLALANEVMDVTYDTWSNAALQMGQSLRDIVLTVAVPTLLFIAARWVPRLFAPLVLQEETDADPDGERGGEPADHPLGEEAHREVAADLSADGDRQ